MQCQPIEAEAVWKAADVREATTWSVTFVKPKRSAGANQLLAQFALTSFVATGKFN